MGRERSTWCQWGIFCAAALLVLRANVTGHAVAQESQGDALLITSRHDRYSQIVRLKADGSGRKALTSEKEFAADPALSPDGKRIAFVAAAEETGKEVGLFVMDADGSGRKRLAEKAAGDGAPAAPHWSPDGKRIAFCTVDKIRYTNPPRLYVVDADGRNLKRLDKVEALAPVWSPDGKRLLLTRLDKRGPNLWVVDVDGTNLRELVKGGCTGAWSPDGKSLAYTALFVARGGLGPDAEPGGLFVARADGSNPKRIAEVGKQGFLKTEPSLLHFSGVQWSRDSKRLFFSRVGQRGLDKTVKPWTVEVIDADGRNLRQVAAADAPEYLGVTTLDR